MVRLPAAIFCLLVGLAAASDDDNVICRSPDRYSADVLNALTFQFFQWETDFANKVTVQTLMDPNVDVQVVVDFANGVRKVVTPAGCEETASPLLPFITMAAAVGSDDLGTFELNGRNVTGFRQTLVPGVVQEIFVDLKPNKICYPAFERILVGEEVVAKSFFFNVKEETSAVVLPDTSNCVVVTQPPPPPATTSAPPDRCCIRRRGRNCRRNNDD